MYVSEGGIHLMIKFVITGDLLFVFVLFYYARVFEISV